MSAAILQSKVFYGLKTDVSGNAHYISDSDVLYPVGNALAIHNFDQKRQKLLRLPDKYQINIIEVSPDKKQVALCEVGDKPTISIYDLNTLRRRKALGIPYECPEVKKFTCISFSFDSQYLAAVTDQPDQTMLFYAWEKGKVESSIKVLNTQNPNSIVDQISCNPSDIGLVALAGLYTFKFMTVSETVWRPYGFTKAENLILTSLTWLNTDRLLAGTRDGRILFLENGELKNIYQMTDISSMNFKVREEFVIASTASQTTLNESEIPEHEIRCLTCFSKGFVFGHGPGKIIVFEKDGAHKFAKKIVFQIPLQVSKNSEQTSKFYQINSISVNPSSDKLLVTSEWAQIFTGKLWGDTMLTDTNPQDLQILGQPLHHGPINSLSMCVWKSIFMTSGSEDRSVRIWDFESENLVMLKHYQEEIFSVALHPIGLFCLIGFSDKLRFMTILIDDLLIMREFSIRNCQIVTFSHGGHFFSAVNGNVIHIYSTMGFMNKFILRGHTGKIRDAVWSNSDMKFISVGSEGAIYTWDMSTGLRTGEIILKGVSLSAATISSDNQTILCISSDNKIREIREDAVVRVFDLESTELRTLLVGKNDNLTFVTSPGGVILSFKSPLQEPIEFKPFHIHSADITNISFSFNEQVLISAGIDGSLCFWKIISAETSLEIRDLVYTSEVLIGKYDLEEKIQKIEDLTVRMRELEIEQAYKSRQIEVQNIDKIRELHQVYTEVMEELKCKIDMLQEEKTTELNNINAEIAKMKKGHEKAMADMEINYDNKLIVEYDKYSEFERKNNEMREDYESKLSALDLKWQEEVAAVKKNLEAIIHEKNMQIEETQEEMAHQVRLHEVIKEQIEDDTDREIIEIRSGFEAQLYEEKQANLKLKGEAGVLRNKYNASQKEIDDLKRQVIHLQSEVKVFQKTIQELEKDVADLKSEISERDSTIQEKEKKIYELKRANQELEKYKFVLNYKIKELKNIIEPKDDEIKELKEKMSDMEIELMSFQKRCASMELKLNDAREKMVGAKKEASLEAKRSRSAQVLIGKMRKDLADVAALIQYPNALRSEVRKLYHRYSDEKEFLRAKEADSEAYCEFYRQRDQLEKTVASLQKQVFKKSEEKGEKKSETIKQAQDGEN